MNAQKDASCKILHPTFPLLPIFVQKWKVGKSAHVHPLFPLFPLGKWESGMGDSAGVLDNPQKFTRGLLSHATRKN